MTTFSPTPTTLPPGSWTVGGAFLDALARRNFTALDDCLDPDVRFRALVPPGLLEEQSAAAMVGHLRRWFGAADEFDLLDAALGESGARLYLRWRAQVRDANGLRAVEQHAFARVEERIVALDLLCSGFHPVGASDERPN